MFTNLNSLLDYIIVFTLHVAALNVQRLMVLNMEAFLDLTKGREKKINFARQKI
jgi:hypothetical protein